jgi:hypothetical protein
VVLADPNAPKLEAAMTVGYPHGDGNRTDAQLTILVPRAQLKTTSAGDAAVYTIEVIGEVLRDEKLWEKYRYRFDFPSDFKDEKLPIVIDRMLRPAAYVARVKLTDPATGAQTILESPLQVPEIHVAPTAIPTVETATLAAINADLQSTRASLRIVPLSVELTGGVTSGVQTIRAAAILQLLLGNVGRPGGGIMALRGHASIQGSTDIPTLYDILPGYLPMPTSSEHDLASYLKKHRADKGWWHNIDKYMVSLLKAYYGDAATRENSFGVALLPRLTGDHSYFGYWLDMADG